MSHYPPITPHLAIDDVAAALEFYPRAFGATERLRLSLPDGSITHAELELNGALVTLGAAIKEYGLVAPDNSKALNYRIAIRIKQGVKPDWYTVNKATFRKQFSTSTNSITGAS